MPITLITGTSSGIGKATALHLARTGHKVYATVQKLDQRHDLVAEAEGLSIEVLELDVENDESVTAAVERILKLEERIDICINNAGIAPLGTVERCDASTIRQTFEVNFFGALRVTCAVLPGMRRHRSGTIVNISSAAAHVALPALGGYAASKSALESISESLASEVYSYGIRVKLIEPGFVTTPILRRGLESLELTSDSPYYDVERHTHMLFAQGEQTGSSPQVVAEAIEAAINDLSPQLRYRATADAELLINGRARMTDEEWISMGRHSSDEDYFGEFATRFPS